MRLCPLADAPCSTGHRSPCLLWIKNDLDPFSSQFVEQTTIMAINVEVDMPILLWLLGIPIPIILLLILLWH
ncbi:hypothetical protein [Sphingomonas nostoxanthinifaciens]|uniref:hypothetical protein n=1 Tax=Sphingomonas nostoxanthinifaciens TaxID=2872652 RepID=UPI001CC1DFEB|nr:hypothetical protein [Sphingomonas nostoxanthinifaciens]UAK25934.1 hypothetical protein K8P63_07380 [Sphingomonas nostoxanthinifaciens]